MGEEFDVVFNWFTSYERADGLIIRGNGMKLVFQGPKVLSARSRYSGIPRPGLFRSFSAKTGKRVNDTS